MLKKIAQKIMKSKIEEMQNEINELRNNGLKQSEEWSKALKEMADLTQKQKYKIDELNDEIKDLKHQNDMLRQYYHLNEEPSEEVQTKMRIDMRCHDLERELDHQRNIADMAKVTLPLLNYNYDLINNQFANMLTMTKYGGRYW